MDELNRTLLALGACSCTLALAVALLQSCSQQSCSADVRDNILRLPDLHVIPSHFRSSCSDLETHVDST